MVWFTNQSLILILISFVLGLLVGYLWWGLRLRKVRTTESTEDAVITPAAPLAVAAPAPVESVPAESAAAESVPAESEPVPVAVASEPVEADEPAESVEPAEPAASAEPEPVAETAAAEPATADGAADGATDGTVDGAADDALVADVESAFAAVPVAEVADEPAEKRADDLERIEGIGPKIAAALRAAGITTYAELADADRATVEDALTDANLRFAPSLGTWSQQARLLADGDEEGFKELTDRLIAGREVTAKPTNATTDQPVEPATETQAEPASEAQAEPASEAQAEAQAEPNAEKQAEPDGETLIDAAEEAPADPADKTLADPVGEPSAPVVSAEPTVKPTDEPADELTGEPVAESAVEPGQVAGEPVAESESDGAGESVPGAGEEPAVVVPAQAVAVEDLPPDDLKRIEGIGPKMSAALVAGGIRTFAQLAAADVDTLRSAIEAAGLRFAPSIVTWARQAKLLADGDEEGFADLTRRLVAGRDTGRA